MMPSKHVAVREDDGRLLLDFRYRGRRCREYLNLKTTKSNKRHAERLAAKVEEALLLGNFRYADFFPESPKLNIFGYATTSRDKPFNDFLDMWFADFEREYNVGLRKWATYRTYRNRLKAVRQFFEGMNVTEVRRQHVEDFKLTCLENGMSGTTVNNALICVRGALNRAYDLEVIDTSPAARVKNIKPEKPDIIPFSKDEVGRILSHSAKEYPRHHPFFATLLLTGMRVGEALAMKWEYIDWDRGTYTIREAFANNRLGTPKTPGSERTIKLGQHLLGTLEAQKNVSFIVSPFVFINSYGQSFTSTMHIMKHAWRPMLAELDIDYRILYQCRHTYAVLSLIAGEDINSLAQQLGHNSLQMLFTRYARFIPNNHKAEPKVEELLFDASATPDWLTPFDRLG